MRRVVVRLGSSVEDATKLPSEPSEELSRPQVPHGMLRILPFAEPGVSAMSYQDLGTLDWGRHDGFRTAVQIGLILVAFDSNWHSWPDALKEARVYVHGHRQSPFDIGVFAFPPDEAIEPDLIMDLAAAQIVVARSEGRTSIDRASTFVAEFRNREAAEHQNFREFESQTDALRMRVEASRRRK